MRKVRLSNNALERSNKTSMLKSGLGVLFPELEKAAEHEEVGGEC